MHPTRNSAPSAIGLRVIDTPSYQGEPTPGGFIAPRGRTYEPLTRAPGFGNVAPTSGAPVSSTHGMRLGLASLCLLALARIASANPQMLKGPDLQDLAPHSI